MCWWLWSDGICISLVCELSGFWFMWFLVRQWLGFDYVHPTNLFDHFLQFGNSAGTSKARHTFCYFNLVCVHLGYLEGNEQ